MQGDHNPYIYVIYVKQQLGIYLLIIDIYVHELTYIFSMVLILLLALFTLALYIVHLIESVTSPHNPYNMM